MKAEAVISDDRKFLSILEIEGIQFIIPTDIIAMLAINGKISKDEAIEALDKIRNLVREDNYHSSKEMIGGK